MIDVPGVINSSLKTSQYTYPDISADTLYPSVVIGGDFFDRGGLCASDVANTNATTVLNDLFNAAKIDSTVEAKN